MLGHVDLAAHLAHFRHIAAFELLRHVLERADIGGDVFALGAIAAGGGGDEFALLVAQRHREPVDFRLGAEGDLVVLELEEALDAGDEIQHVRFRKRVVERQHRHRVSNLGKAAGRLGADLLRRRVAGDELRKSGLDGVEALAQRVVCGVGNLRRIFLVVGPVMALDLQRQAFQLDLGFRLGEGFDVGMDHFFGFCDHDGHINPSFRNGPQDHIRNLRHRRFQQPLRGRPGFGGDFGAGQHARDFLAAVIGGERLHSGSDTLALFKRIL